MSAGGAAKKQAVGGVAHGALTHDLLTQQPPPLEQLATLVGGAKTSAIASDPAATEPPAAPAAAAPPAPPPAPAVKVTLDKFNFVPSEHFSVMGWEIFIEDSGGGSADGGDGGPTFVEASSKLHGIDHFLVTEHRPEGSEKAPVKVSHNPQTIKPANISNVLLYHPIPDQLMVKAVGSTGAILTQGVVQIASTAPPKPQPTVTQLKQKREREQQSKLKTEQKAAAKKKTAEAAEATAVASAAATVTTSPAAAAAATAPAAAAVMAACTAVKAEGTAHTSATAPSAGAAASKDAAAGEDIEQVRKQQQELERTVHQQAEELAQLKKMLQDVQAQKMLQAGGGDEKKSPAAPKL